MKAEEATELIEFLEQNGVEVYVDGGWAVDAVLGEQTREHEDLDVAVPEKHVLRLRELLAARGYRERLRDDTWECNFVLVDPQGREIDVHSYTLDEAGNNIHGVPYARKHLTGNGYINGYAVRCVPPEWLVKFHTGYKLDQNDFRDVRALCKRFGIELPDEYVKEPENNG
jgi:lincosamide nucleotidyltransferase A/C/D/E